MAIKKKLANPELLESRISPDTVVMAVPSYTVQNTITALLGPGLLGAPLTGGFNIPVVGFTPPNGFPSNWVFYPGFPYGGWGPPPLKPPTPAH